ncbi:ImmA/IrrE family metallo-endopeptidase [Mycetocola saprophilus]|uniref:ImmA/IrrE family metallo-endopeptidase n=1 Tax=Mycetocola saprophilus TaxID=76636 RepID=UPI003BF12A90
MQQYNPHEHAQQLGIRVRHQTLGKRYGLWVPRIGMILLRPGMAARHERSVLAHEIAHAEYGHTTGSRKEERLADVLAARRLIAPAAIADAMRWTQELPELAIELGVTEHIVKTYLDEIFREADSERRGS